MLQTSSPKIETQPPVKIVRHSLVDLGDSLYIQAER